MPDIQRSILCYGAFREFVFVFVLCVCHEDINMWAVCACVDVGHGIYCKDNIIVNILLSFTWYSRCLFYYAIVLVFFMFNYLSFRVFGKYCLTILLTDSWISEICNPLIIRYCFLTFNDSGCMGLLVELFKRKVKNLFVFVWTECSFLHWMCW